MKRKTHDTRKIGASFCFNFSGVKICLLKFIKYHEITKILVKNSRFRYKNRDLW